MILKLLVEFVEGAFSQIAVTFQQERTVGALGERFLAAIAVEENADFMSTLVSWERLVITIEAAAPSASNAPPVRSKHADASGGSCGAVIFQSLGPAQQ